MSFVDGFFSFNLDITNTDVHTYVQTRVKLARHPEEEPTELPARVLAYCHCYEDGLVFSRGRFEPKEPTIWRKNILEESTHWIEVGCPDAKKLKRALRHNRLEMIRVYFFESDQVREFCHYLRGSKENWIDRIDFYLLDPEMIDFTLEQTSGKTEIAITFVEDDAYLTIGEREHAGKVLKLNMWSEFQKSLQPEGSAA